MVSEIFSSAFLSWGMGLIKTYGYIGVFLVNVVGSATIFFPVPSFSLVFILGAVLNPWLLGISAAAGASLGELTGYGLGFGGRALSQKKLKKWFNLADKWRKKHGFFAVIVIFAATPLPMDVVGILSGTIKYDVKRFLLAVFIGKLAISWVLAWGGFFGIKQILEIFGS